jgi:hypothetical protein
MARKQLVKGANAARLEERIARVPADLGPKESIFGAITEMEKGASASKEESTAKPSRRKPAQPKTAQISRIGPSDFTNAEREAILRCCEDYRNRLPIYLQSVQREVKVIDAVIEKCKSAKKE